MKRPLGWVIACYAAGIIAANLAEVTTWIWLGLGLAAATACLVSERLRPWLLPVLLVLCGAANLTRDQQQISPIDLRSRLGPEPELAFIQGIVERVELRANTARAGEETFRTSACIRVEAIQREDQTSQSAYGWVLATTTSQDETDLLKAGDHVRVFGVVASPPGAFARGMFNYREHLARRGVYHRLEFEGPADVQVLKAAQPPLGNRFRDWAVATLAEGLPKDAPAVGLLWAMTLGLKTSLTDDMAEPFMRSGTMHLFAISGLHIGLIAGILVALLRLVRIPRHWVGLVAIPCLWFFTAATGWQPSAVRATIMMSIVLMGWSLRRPVDLLNSLSAAAFLILLWDPRQLFHAGFQLSFAVVASIAIVLPPLERLRQRLMKSDPFLPPELRPRWQRWLDAPARFVTMAVAVSVAAWLGSLPLIMHYFHLITPVGLLANVVIVQCGALALASALGSLICAPFVPLFTDLFNHSAWFFANGMLFFSDWFSGLPMAAFNVKSPPLVTTLCYYGVLWLAVSGWLIRLRKTCLPLAALLLLTGVVVWKWEYSSPRLSVLPLNGGHALFLENSPTGNWLIDSGDEGNWQFRVRPFLQANGINRLDNFVLTHGDVRHVGAGTNVLAEFAPRRVVLNPLPQRSPPYRRIEDTLKQSTADVIRPVAGDAIEPWRVLHPSSDTSSSRADSTALAMELRLSDTTIWHLPDLDATAFEALAQGSPGTAPDLIVASPIAGGVDLARAVEAGLKGASLVVVDSNFPATERVRPAIRERFNRSGMPIEYTSETGALEIRWDKDQLRVTSVRE